MIKVIIALSGALAVIIGLSFLVIKSLRKKNKSLQFKLDFADARIDQMMDNKRAYENKLKELNEIQSKYGY